MACVGEKNESYDTFHMARNFVVRNSTVVAEESPSSFQVIELKGVFYCIVDSASHCFDCPK